MGEKGNEGNHRKKGKVRHNHQSETKETMGEQAQKGNSRVRLEMTNKRAKTC